MTTRRAAIELLTEAGRSPEYIVRVLARVESMINNGAGMLDKECGPGGKEALGKILHALRMIDKAVPGAAREIALKMAQEHNSKS